MLPLRDEEVGRLDVAVHDARRVSGVERIGDLDGERQQQFDVERPSRDAVLQRHAIQELHGDERLAVVLADVVIVQMLG